MYVITAKIGINGETPYTHYLYGFENANPGWSDHIHDAWQMSHERAKGLKEFLRKLDPESKLQLKRV